MVETKRRQETERAREAKALAVTLRLAGMFGRLTHPLCPTMLVRMSDGLVEERAMQW